MSPFSYCLADCKVNDVVELLEFQDVQIGARLMSMGILPGCTIHLLAKAPFGGGVCLYANGYRIGLRTEEARFLIVQ